MMAFPCQTEQNKNTISAACNIPDIDIELPTRCWKLTLTRLGFSKWTSSHGPPRGAQCLQEKQSLLATSRAGVDAAASIDRQHIHHHSDWYNRCANLYHSHFPRLTSRWLWSMSCEQSTLWFGSRLSRSKGRALHPWVSRSDSSSSSL